MAGALINAAYGRSSHAHGMMVGSNGIVASGGALCFVVPICDAACFLSSECFAECVSALLAWSGKLLSRANPWVVVTLLTCLRLGLILQGVVRHLPVQMPHQW